MPPTKIQPINADQLGGNPYESPYRPIQGYYPTGPAFHWDQRHYWEKRPTHMENFGHPENYRATINLQNLLTREAVDRYKTNPIAARLGQGDKALRTANSKRKKGRQVDNLEGMLGSTKRSGDIYQTAMRPTESARMARMGLLANKTVSQFLQQHAASQQQEMAWAAEKKRIRSEGLSQIPIIGPFAGALSQA